MNQQKRYYMQVTRHIWAYDISDKAKLLFLWLCELEQRYTGKDTKVFYHTDAELAAELGWSLKTLKITKAELNKTDLLEIFQVNLINPETGKKQEKHITGYRILK